MRSVRPFGALDLKCKRIINLFKSEGIVNSDVSCIEDNGIRGCFTVTCSISVVNFIKWIMWSKMMDYFVPGWVATKHPVLWCIQHFPCNRPDEKLPDEKVTLPCVPRWVCYRVDIWVGISYPYFYPRVETFHSNICFIS